MNKDKEYTAQVEDNVATPVQPGFIAEHFFKASSALTEAIAKRRGHIDEMEKLIGVRSLDQHPDGINGGVVALLGITNQLETKSRIGWDTFVIGELLNYIKGVGTTEELMVVIDNKQKELTDQMEKAWGAYGEALGKLDIVQELKDNPSKYASMRGGLRNNRDLPPGNVVMGHMQNSIDDIKPKGIIDMVIDSNRTI